MDKAPDLEFWRARYRERRTPWDLGEPSAPAQKLAAAHLAPASRVFVPGCGRGHEVLLLARQGHSVLAADFAPEAVAELSARAAAQGLAPDIRLLDIFDLPGDLDGTFDAVLELACLVALGPTRFADYEALMRRLLKRGGKLLAVLMEAPGIRPPPFSISLADAQALFGPPRWRLEGHEAVQPPDPRRPGPETAAVFVKTG